MFIRVMLMFQSSSSSMGLKTDAVFKAMIEQLGQRKGVAKKINAVFAWEIMKDGKKAAEWSKLADKFDDCTVNKKFISSPGQGEPM